MSDDTRRSSEVASVQRGLRLHPADNVATVLAAVSPGPLQIFDGKTGSVIVVLEPIADGHKVALCAIAADEPIVKYGVTIGVATEGIMSGAWVHTHNCRSRLDERSHTLDRHTGATTDTPYV